MVEEDHAKPIATEKLRLLKSPIVDITEKQQHGTSATPRAHGEGDLPDLSHLGGRPGTLEDMPVFRKHEDASILELFFDLFFAANYTIFSQTQAMTNHDRFKAYVGYFSLLWATWFLVSLYDVRFVTDSFFERGTRAVHLAVMVGFAVVAPHFEPSNQDIRTMKTLSIILMISRFCLATEYSSILWHVRKFPKARTPLYIQIGFNLIAAFVYMGITFRFHSGGSRVFVAWYVAAGLECILAVIISNVWDVLSLTKTHLMRRMSLLTVVILGDGIVSVAQNVVDLVETPDSWNSAVIGFVTSAAVTIYLVFLVYFDWMRYSHLPPWRQQLWTALHYPFHLSLVIFMQSTTQFIIWSKAVNVISNLKLDGMLNSIPAMSVATSHEIKTNLTTLSDDFFARYPPTYYDAWQTYYTALDNVTDIPNSFWPKFAKYAETMADSDSPPADQFIKFSVIVTTIGSVMLNSLFQALKIDIQGEEQEEDPTAGADTSNGGFQIKVNEKTWSRFKLMFALGYIAAGCTLLVMVGLTIVSRVRPWRAWPVVRTVLNLLLALGMGLVSTLYYQPIKLDNYLWSPWLSPTICLTWLVVLVLTHVHDAPTSLREAATGFFNWPKMYSAARRKGQQSAAGFEPRRHVDGSDVELWQPRRDSFYEHGGYGHSGYGGFNGQQQDVGLGLHDSSSYEPYRQTPPDAYKPIGSSS